MNVKKLLTGVVATGALVFGAQLAQAAVICTGCEYGDDAGTYLGSYDPTTFDFGTFQHSDGGQDHGPNTAFEDFWVFDLDPGGNGSISADFTAFTSIADFAGELYADGGSTCAGSDCSSVVLGALLESEADVNGDRRW